MTNIISFEQQLLKSQIAENSRQIDEWLKELREVAIRLENEVNSKKEAIA